MSYQLPVTSLQLKKTVSRYACVTGYWLLVTGYFFSFFFVSVTVEAVEIENVTFGFSDGYKVGTWAPLTVTARNPDEGILFRGELVVEVRNFSSDIPLERYAASLHLIGLDRQQKNFYVYCPKNATQLVIRLIPSTRSETVKLGGTASDVVKDILLPTPIARKDYFVLVLAPSGDTLKRCVDKKQLAVSGDAQVHVKYLPNSGTLPRDWIGYNAVDVLVIREVGLTDRRILKAQQTAMLDWIQRGGTLIVSGGSNFNYLQDSFIEPFLPVELKGIKKMDTLPVVVLEQLNRMAVSRHSRQQKGVTSPEDLLTESRQPMAESQFECIQLAPKAGCEVLIGTAEQMYVAKRSFGDGQIICLAFDYNAPPFDEKFWYGLLSHHGKSPRHLADRYALALQHEAEIYKHFLSEMPARVPLIKLLAILLPLYLLGLGVVLLYFGKSKQKSRTYWIGGGLFVLISVITITSAQTVWFPNTLTADSLSIVSVYPERQRAHVLRYVSLRSPARAETSVDFAERTFVRHQKVERVKGEHLQEIGTLIQDSRVQLRDVSVELWQPTTYVEEKFLTVDTQQLPHTLENTWRIAENEMVYLGDVARSEALRLETHLTFDPSIARLRLRVTPKLPPDEELEGIRKTFAQILQRDYVLRYLATEPTPNPSPYFMGWVSQDLTGTVADGNIDTNDETFVIFRPGAEH